LAKEQGANGVLLVAPYYNKPTQEGLYHHYMAIAEKVDIPIIVYNVPGRSGINITAETQLRLAEECPNVIATKEASADLEQMSQIMKYAPEGFNLFSGDDVLTLPIVALGGKGCNLGYIKLRSGRILRNDKTGIKWKMGQGSRATLQTAGFDDSEFFRIQSYSGKSSFGIDGND
jgi:hypothetical protein